MTTTRTPILASVERDLDAMLLAVELRASSPFYDNEQSADAAHEGAVDLVREELPDLLEAAEDYVADHDAEVLAAVDVVVALLSDAIRNPIVARNIADTLDRHGHPVTSHVAERLRSSKARAAWHPGGSEGRYHLLIGSLLVAVISQLPLPLDVVAFGHAWRWVVYDADTGTSQSGTCHAQPRYGAERAARLEVLTRVSALYGVSP